MDLHIYSEQHKVAVADAADARHRDIWRWRLTGGNIKITHDRAFGSQFDAERDFLLFMAAIQDTWLQYHNTQGKQGKRSRLPEKPT